MKRSFVLTFLCVLTTAVSALLAQAPSVVVPPNKALVLVRVPADATVKIAGYTVTQRGVERWLYTPELAANQEYHYEIEAVWVEDGQQKRVSRKIEVRAGQLSTVEFGGVTAGKGEKIAPPQVVEKKPSVKAPVKERLFLFTYAGAIKGLTPGQQASVWLPLAETSPEQEAILVKMTAPGDPQYGTEKQYRNRMAFFQAKANDKGEIPFEMKFRVLRKEVKTDVSANLVLQPRAEENLLRFLQPDARVPITGKPLDLIKDKNLPNDQFAAAKVLYDVVNTHMKYSKEGKGWGQGDSVWACDSKFGNCSDFHSLFISMARGNKIPSKFEMGFPIPPKRGDGVVGGYHCWAWFLPDRRGWVPVDISEANRNPELKEYYFGNLTEDRVRFTTGRDINLEPRQKGPPLNFFIYPYAEVDGEPHPQEMIERRFAYQDVK